MRSSLFHLLFFPRFILVALTAMLIVLGECWAPSVSFAAKHRSIRPASTKFTNHGASKKKKRRRRRRPVGPRLYSGVPLKILSNTTTRIAPGVSYSLKTISKNQWRVGIVHANLDDGYRVALIKAKEKAVGFERVEDLVHRLDSAQGVTAVAAVNSNYWRAGVGTVIGVAAAHGEMVGFDNIKPWARFIVRDDGTFAIAADTIAAMVMTTHGSVPINSVNIRHTDTSVVLYNHFFGATLPPVDTTVRGDSLTPHRGVDTALQRFLQDTTELFYETDEDITPPDSLIPKPRSEEQTLKCMAVAIDTPRVNVPFRCQIRAMTSRLVPILRNGIALSFPRADSVRYRTFHTGDTIRVLFQVGDGSGGGISEMLMAGPRLVRNGRVSLETVEENFHRASFINGGHARTAIGYSKDQREVVLVTVDRPMGTRKKGRPGIGLRDLARILVAEGAYDAMNFDGGSSTTLVVNGKTVLPDTGKEFSRHVASAIAIVKRK